MKPLRNPIRAAIPQKDHLEITKRPLIILSDKTIMKKEENMVEKMRQRTKEEESQQEETMKKKLLEGAVLLKLLQDDFRLHEEEMKKRQEDADDDKAHEFTMATNSSTGERSVEQTRAARPATIPSKNAEKDVEVQNLKIKGKSIKIRNLFCCCFGLKVCVDE